VFVPRGLGFDLPAFLAPLENIFVTSPFGTRAAGNHAGLDLRAAIGTPVQAAAAGVVQFAGVQSGYGNIVTVDHGGGVVSKYAHLSSILVGPGQPVAAGQTIGLSGDTGNVTGPHLHFEVTVNGVPVDPASALGAGAPAVVSGGSGAGWDASGEDLPADDAALPADGLGGLSPLALAALVALGAAALLGGGGR
jgi:murein DD-endopeptidase MepM/ murein hydrolase activator NlpD